MTARKTDAEEALRDFCDKDLLALRAELVDDVKDYLIEQLADMVDADERKRVTDMLAAMCDMGRDLKHLRRVLR